MDGYVLFLIKITIHWFMLRVEPYILLQLTDTHILPDGAVLSGNVDTCAYLEQAIKQIGRLAVKPQAVLVTGDLVDDGKPQSYRHFRQIFSALDLPLYVLPGNHDSREHMLEAFPEMAQDLHLEGTEFIQYVVEFGGVRVIALDTLVPGKPYGELCAARLQWLADRLAEKPDQPTIVAMHHPPFNTGVLHMDQMGLVGGREEFMAVIAKNPQVQRVICGHVHRLCMQSFGGTLAATAPSVAHQLAFQFAPSEPAGYTFEPAGCLLHLWKAPECRVTSHLMALSDYAGPFTF